MCADLERSSKRCTDPKVNASLERSGRPKHIGKDPQQRRAGVPHTRRHSGEHIPLQTLFLRSYQNSDSPRRQERQRRKEAIRLDHNDKYPGGIRNIPTTDERNVGRILVHEGLAAWKEEEVQAPDRAQSAASTPGTMGPYRSGPASHAFQKEHLENMIKMGVIELTSTAWAVPIFFTRMKDRTLLYCPSY